MTYAIPSPTNATYVARVNGRSDAAHEEIGTQIEEPKFVDNAVHHAVFTTAGQGDVLNRDNKISKPVSNDFVTTHERTYRFAEEVSSLRLSHHNSEDSPFYNGELLNPNSTLPPLLIDANDSSLKLKPKQIVDTENGTRMVLLNMRGKTLSDFGMKDTTHFRLAHLVSVGLRTTDLIQKLFNDSLHG